MTTTINKNSNVQSNLTAEVVSIGDEMTSGARLDTNAQWLSQRLGDLGVEVIFHSAVGDTISHNIDVFRLASERADIVVATGGLGPTRDDLTREALAGAVDRPLELSESALLHLQALFARRCREMPQRNRLQAMFPQGSQEIFNPQGTAPGVDLPVARKGKSDSRIFALPGVPAEMKRMFDETVAERILQMAGDAKCITHAVMKFFGTGESDMEERLGDMISRDRQPRVGITVSTATISLRISAISADQKSCDELIASTREEILDRVGDMHFGDGEDFEQYHAVEFALRERNESLVVVELGHAAPLGDWFASLGKTPAYRGGVSFAEEDDLGTFLGQGDFDSAILMLCELFSANWLLLVNRYPELDHGSDGPIPASDIVFQVVHANEEILSHEISMGGHPAILQQRIGKTALQWFRQVLADEADNGNNECCEICPVVLTERSHDVATYFVFHCLGNVLFVPFVIGSGNGRESR